MSCFAVIALFIGAITVLATFVNEPIMAFVMLALMMVVPLGAYFLVKGSNNYFGGFVAALLGMAAGVWGVVEFGLWYYAENDGPIAMFIITGLVMICFVFFIISEEW